MVLNDSPQKSSLFGFLALAKMIQTDNGGTRYTEREYGERQNQTS